MQNIHATGIVVADRGLLITGPSGSGKSTLALSLISRCDAEKVFARLVSDDQLFVRTSGKRLVATVPQSIAGLAEVRGLGPIRFAFERAAVVDLVVRLVPAHATARLDPNEYDQILGVRIPRIDLPERNVNGAAVAVLARLSALRNRAIVS